MCTFTIKLFLYIKYTCLLKTTPLSVESKGQLTVLWLMKKRYAKETFFCGRIVLKCYTNLASTFIVFFLFLISFNANFCQFDKAGYKILDPSKGHMHCDVIVWVDMTYKQHEYKKSIGHFRDFAFLKRMQMLKTTQVIL